MNDKKHGNGKFIDQNGNLIKEYKKIEVEKENWFWTSFKKSLNFKIIYIYLIMNKIINDNLLLYIKYF